MSQLDLHSLRSAAEDARVPLGISLSDRKREIRHYGDMSITEIAAGEPRSTTANEVHGDSFAGSTPCNGKVMKS